MLVYDPQTQRTSKSFIEVPVERRKPRTFPPLEVDECVALDMHRLIYSLPRELAKESKKKSFIETVRPLGDQKRTTERIGKEKQIEGAIKNIIARYPHLDTKKWTAIKWRDYLQQDAIVKQQFAGVIPYPTKTMLRKVKEILRRIHAKRKPRKKPA